MKHLSLFLLVMVFIACGSEEPTDAALPQTTPEINTEENSTSDVVPGTITPEQAPIDTTTPLAVNPEGTSEIIPPPVADIIEAENKDELPITEPTLPLLLDEASGIVAEGTVPVPEEETVIALRPDHSSWDALLKKNVSSSGKVNYKGMKSSLQTIDQYIKLLQGFNDRSDWSKNEKLAFWINLYNAATVRMICQNYPVASITNLHGGKPWNQKVVTIGSKGYTLNQIENDIIRPKFKDARIHFAVNCAAKSCPRLMNGAFLPEKLSYQLDKMTKAFINKSGKNTIEEKKIKLSKIFEWYAVDFTSKGTVIDYLNKYSTTTISEKAKIEYLEYDWALNE